MKNKIKHPPKFKSEAEEQAFFLKSDALEYFDTSTELKLNLSKLKPSTSFMTIRMPTNLIDDLKRVANKKDVPYQSMVKMILIDSLKSKT